MPPTFEKNCSHASDPVMCKGTGRDLKLSLNSIIRNRTKWTEICMSRKVCRGMQCAAKFNDVLFPPTSCLPCINQTLHILKKKPTFPQSTTLSRNVSLV